MEGIKEFLESSTIHGVTYISTNKNPFIKLLWIGIVVTGFSIASILINNSFSDWENSPIATTTETFSMSKSIFPKITVCPPKGTSTSLNYDLVKAENQTLTKTTRNKMTELTKILFQDGLFFQVAANETSFKEDQKYRNWY